MSINKKNVVWWTGITNPDHNEKYGGFKFFEYSKKRLVDIAFSLTPNSKILASLIIFNSGYKKLTNFL